MKNLKSFSMFSFMIVVVLITVSSCKPATQSGDTSSEETPSTPSLSKGVETILAQRMQKVRQLLKDPIILEAVQAANLEHQNIMPEKIQELDQQWRKSKGVDEFIQPFLTSPCANQLKAFQSRYEGYPEIFVTGEKGLNVCQTNKTSDYYQADEAWWVDGFDEGRGKAYHGEIEYDESARFEAISLYLPVKNSGGKTIGVCKAVVDVTSIKEAL